MMPKVYNIINGIGPLGNTTGYNGSTAKFSLTGPLGQFTTVISTIIGVMTIIGGLIFMAQIISAGLAWLASGGEKQALQNAQKKLTHAVVGLAIVILAYTIIGAVGQIFGLDILFSSDLIANLIP